MIRSRKKRYVFSKGLPKISIITPSYNQGKYIEETICSVINQDYPALEYLIFDGDSNDNTIDVIKKYEDYITYWVSEPDKGQTDAVSKGFQMATGDIIGWLNSDDQYYSSNIFKEVASFFFKNPDIDACYGDNVYIDADNNLLYLRKGVPFYSKRLLYIWNFIHQPTVFMRKRIVKEIALNLSLNYVMDYEYWLRIAPKYKFKYIKLLISASRWHNDCKTISSAKNMFSELRYIYKTLSPGHINNFLPPRKVYSFFYTLDRIYSLPFLFSINSKKCNCNINITSWNKLMKRQILGLRLGGVPERKI